MDFADSYLGGLRALVGHRPLLAVGVSVLIEQDGTFLLLRRSDTGAWGLPGGSMELGESLIDAVHREVREETNAILNAVQVFGISSDPAVEGHTYPNGDTIQNVAVLVHAGLEPGEIRSNDHEALEFRFAAAADIDPAGFVKTEYPTFAHWRRFTQTRQFQFV